MFFSLWKNSLVTESILQSNDSDRLRVWLGQQQKKKQLNKTLLEAVQYASLEMVEMLVHAGADIHHDQKKWNAMNAVAYNHTSDCPKILSYLTDQNVNPNIESEYGETAMSVFSRRGLFNHIQSLVTYGASESFLMFDDLARIIALGSTQDLKTFLNAGGDCKHISDRWNRTPLLLATHTGGVEKVKLLLEHGASLEEVTPDNENALFFCVSNDHVEVLSLLLSRGIDIQLLDDDKNSALMKASVSGATKCVQILLNAGVDPFIENYVQSSAIDEATNIETVKILVEYGADVNRINGQGYSVLMNAVETQDYSFVKALLEFGVDPNASSTGETALFLAVRSDNKKIAAILMAHDANVNASDVDGDTALSGAKSTDMAALLLQKGAMLDITNMFGITVVETILDKNVKKFVQLNYKGS